MRYQGGKTRLAKKIADHVAPRGRWWEPFCGGLSVSVRLAAFGPGLVSDGNAALISLYQAVQSGWGPPSVVTPDQYASARALPDTDPFKAFAGFGASFSGQWFAGYVGAPGVREYRKQGCRAATMWVDPVAAARNALLRDLKILKDCEFQHLDFCRGHPGFVPECLYLDPPYSGTKGYEAMPPFDTRHFWATAAHWASLGVRVYVSELSPGQVPVDVVFSEDYSHHFGGKRTRSEKLFRVLV